MEMDTLTFGLTLLVVGMGGTLAALAALAGLMELLKKMFPPHTPDARQDA
jgi:Na+-transporting methylmalonyl-CoA/oxaloacetate decarboxylase gamma subunit